MESCLQGDSVQEQLRFLNETWLDHLENLAHLTADRNLPSAKYNVITALLTLDVHRRDVIQSLLSSTILSVNDFEWVRSVTSFLVIQVVSDIVYNLVFLLWLYYHTETMN